MPSLDDVARHQTALSREDVEWLHRLVADWQILADLSFADLVLWLPDSEGKGFWSGAQMRPTTGVTAHLDDLVGDFVPSHRRPALEAAMREGRVIREGDPEWREDIPVRLEAIPVRRDGRVIAVVARSTNLLGVRTPSRLELAYLQIADDLTGMISEGAFPIPGEQSDLSHSPRVGDGLIRVDAAGTVMYASPNGVSAFRRLGVTADLQGADLVAATRALVPAPQRPTDSALSSALTGRVGAAADLENGDASLSLRAIPLRTHGQSSGALVLLRDVTELRGRERELMSKEATIREIHHRVKNNLQTVQALLRLQARRMEDGAGREALEEAVRRIGSIAVVHDTLSQAFDETVEFDEVADRLRQMVAEVSSPARLVTTERAGSFGELRAEVATPLAMVLTELIQNAAEHAFGEEERGHVLLQVERRPAYLRVAVVDDGVGLPVGFEPSSSNSLGLSIVATLVESELGGSLAFGPRSPATGGGGTRVAVEIPLSGR
ncbi:two-component sensor histidine kinase [Mumia flava]|uniref:histidine kinase n=1 Tax=Mumia flava TaxID=1348852 RepID=A0A0B2BPN0_9ACTN|nr:sensor histidine kinase [Mumia flava]PJJ56480.1 two-component sensor histidine kinase [Mumia flava]